MFASFSRGYGFLKQSIALAVAFSAIHIIAGVAAGVLVVGTVMALLNAANSYIQTAYYTSLFIWARQVETAAERGLTPHQVLAPAPLAAVLA